MFKRFLLPAGLLFSLSGCMNNMIDSSTDSINANSAAAQRATQLVRENARLIDEANKIIVENQRLLEKAAQD